MGVFLTEADFVHFAFFGDFGAFLLSASDCLERLVSEMTYYVSSVT